MWCFWWFYTCFDLLRPNSSAEIKVSYIITNG